MLTKKIKCNTQDNIANFRIPWQKFVSTEIDKFVYMRADQIQHLLVATTWSLELDL